jgi:hypothetical protein
MLFYSIRIYCKDIVESSEPFWTDYWEKKVRHRNVFKKIMEKNSVNGGMSQKYIDPLMVSQQQYTQ